MGRKKGKGKAARNATPNQTVDLSDKDASKAPHSFVFHRGHVGKTVKELVLDLRKIMEPYTATKLKVQKKNVLKDFLSIAGPMHVSHFMVLTKSDVSTHLRLMCVPKGPTLTFKVNDFCLAKDVLSSQLHPNLETKLFLNYAVLVTNIPSDTMENKLMNITFKNMFPSINPNTVNLNAMRRTVLVNYEPSDKSIDIRHYTMKVVPVGVSRGVRKLMKSKLPNMSNKKDIADLFLDKGSESEGEMDGPNSQVTVTKNIKDRGVAANTTNSIRLKEIGPRLNLQLIKVEEGFGGGNVLFHAFLEKTAEEIEAQKAIRKEKQKEKLARRQRQEANVKRKEQEKEAQVKRSKEGMERKKQEEEDMEVVKDSDLNNAVKDSDDDEDDDVEYYRQEVGQEPEPELFSSQGKKRKRQTSSIGPKYKKVRQDRTAGKPNRFMKKGSKGRGDDTAKKSKFSVSFNVKKGKKQGFSKPGFKKEKATHRGEKKGKGRPKRR